eukprot:CAMPEP_0179102552 /NCGR_PEP_ID=MMETSP0796-20121207/47471_1 /TAXON_ID=73915 /ORGANISM="Pyrodinium bahamense, Strain pbaha01" /LENGTH=272 /DNA_ID=CAMNT_0020800431 /DNA_START=821 /DNA_END=1639 /DNA_ORIENTATION=-
MCLRSFVRLGAAFSVLSFMHMGSSLSLRGFSRLGSSISVLDFLALGASLSLRRCGRFGENLAVANRIELSNSNTYLRFNIDTNGIEVYVNGQRGLSVVEKSASGGGSLHGVWYSDNLVHTSDRRLKTNIRPLIETLNAQAPVVGAGGAIAGDGAAWVLRELRPVSYHFRQGTESKLQRFGFIADDVIATIPQVVRQSPGQAKGIAYQDLIAVLAAAFQSLQQRLEAHVHEHRSRLEALEAGLKHISAAVTQHTKSMEAQFQAIVAGLHRQVP